MKITFGIVVYHESELLERCLHSIAPVADEIIVIHDGPCQDATVAVAKKFTANVIEGERLGGSDPHRIEILKKSTNNWVFMIDADEFLSPELLRFLQDFKNDAVSTNASAFAFRWPLWDGEKEVTKNNHRACFFDRTRCWAIGLHNFPINTIGTIEKRTEVLMHRPKQSKIGLGLIRGRLATRVNRDAARFLLGWDKLGFFNQDIVPVAFKKRFLFLIAHPLLSAHINLVKHFLGSYRHIYRDGWAGFIVSLQLGLYQYALAKKIWNIQRQQ